MALSRIGTSAEFASLLARSSCAVAANSQQRAPRANAGKLHASVVRLYPEAPQLPLPSNVSEIFNIETARFTPERVRDIATPIFLHSNHCSPDNFACGFGFGNSVKMQQLDSHLDSYDCFGAISLSGTMQTNVPKPFCANGKSTYLNMPGGQWARDGKYLAEIMRKNHFAICRMREIKRNGGLDGSCDGVRFYSTTATKCNNKSSSADEVKAYSGAKDKKIIIGNTDTEKNKQDELRKANRLEKLKIMIRDYGKTVIIFHVTISLMSLGTCYYLVSSGLDPMDVINYVCKNDVNASDQMVKNIMGQGSTFLVAFGIHKIFAPMRISVTLICSPLIVKYLRRKGILKPPPVITKP